MLHYWMTENDGHRFIVVDESVPHKGEYNEIAVIHEPDSERPFLQFVRPIRLGLSTVRRIVDDTALGLHLRRARNPQEPIMIEELSSGVWTTIDKKQTLRNAIEWMVSHPKSTVAAARGAEQPFRLAKPEPASTESEQG